MPEKIIMTDSVDQTAKLFGELDANLDRLESAFGVTIKARDAMTGAGNAICVSGDSLANVAKAVDALGYL